MACKFCGSLCYLLGQLGNLKWFKCRACGMEVSRTIKHRAR